MPPPPTIFMVYGPGYGVLDQPTGKLPEKISRKEKCDGTLGLLKVDGTTKLQFTPTYIFLHFELFLKHVYMYKLALVFLHILSYL